MFNLRKLIPKFFSKKRRTTQNRQKLKIAIVTNSSWYTHNFRLGLLRRLKEMGFEVHVIAPKDHFSAKLIAEGFIFTHLPLSIYSTNPVNELKLIWEFSKIYRKNKFDFIFHYTAKPNIYGSIAAFFNRIPSIAITTGLGLIRDTKARASKFLLFFLYRITSLLSKEVWFLNRDDLNLFRRYKIVSQKKAFLLPSEGVNILEYKPCFDEELIEPEVLKFLYAGRIVKSKGVGEFYQAAKYFKEAGAKIDFEMIGFIVPDHPDAVSFNLIQEWHREGIVKYLGETEDIRPYIKEANCLVLPSYFGEGVPRILLEGASMGLPIITTDFVGCREVVDDGINGFLCEVKNTTDLIEKIEQFLKLDKIARWKMGLAGRKKVLEEFDEEIIIGHYITALGRYVDLETTKRQKFKSKVRIS